MKTNARLTLYHFDSATETYHRQYFDAVSLYTAVKSAAADGGFVYDNTFKIRIPTKAAIEIDTGDYVYIGFTQDTEPDKRRCCKVMEYSDNRRGGLPHWRLECK